LEILEFVYDFTAEIDAKKVLYEFMGRIWGNGNTALHLAAFMGLNELARRLLELGAAPNKVNERKYKPVDCANGEEMMDVFATVSECMLFEFNFPVEPPVKQVELESEASKRIRAKSSTDLNSIKMEEDAVGLNCKSMFALGLKQNEFLHLTKKRHSISNDSNIKPPLSINLPHGTSIPDQNSPLMSPIANSPIKSREEMTRSLTRQSKPPKFLRKVTFDPETLIFDLCSTGDATDPEKLSNLRECLGIALDAPVVPQKKRLSGLKIDVNEIYTPNQWLTPLHMACSSGNLAVVELLVCLAGSRVNLRDKEGWTALHCASAEGHMEIIKVLGRCQGWDGGEERDGWIYPPDGPIELNPRTRDGETPIEVALDENKAEIKALLDGMLLIII
jgi:ankyrin repeat protein